MDIVCIALLGKLMFRINFRQFRVKVKCTLSCHFFRHDVIVSVVIMKYVILLAVVAVAAAQFHRPNHNHNNPLGQMVFL